jgi:predicted transcriptional regulator
MEQITPTAERVSARIAEQIKESGVTVVWLCNKTGIPRSTLNRRLDGHAAFNLNEVDRIAEALRVPASTLIDGVGLSA